MHRTCVVFGASAAFVKRDSRDSGKLVFGCVGSVDGTMVCGGTNEENWDAMKTSVLAFNFSHSDERQKSVALSVGSTAVC